MVFTTKEKLLYILSILSILLSFIIFDRSNYITLIASCIGATALIFNAKAHPIGQFLTVIFSLIYGYISYTYAYYGEMATYLLMTGPIALISFITWLKHPYDKTSSEVEIVTMKKKDIKYMIIYTIIITFIFYFILKYFHTNHLYISTLSIPTSFLAVYMTAKRTPYFALAYACNDIVLIVLWLLATIQDASYVSMLVCFIIFLINDIYTYINWKRIEKRQGGLEYV